MKKQEERLHIFLNAIKNEVFYWATLPSNCFEQARKLRGLSEIQYRLDGLAFSILSFLDGSSSLNDFHIYNIFDEGVEINCGVELHEAFGDYRQDTK